MAGAVLCCCLLFSFLFSLLFVFTFTFLVLHHWFCFLPKIVGGDDIISVSFQLVDTGIYKRKTLIMQERPCSLSVAILFAIVFFCRCSMLTWCIVGWAVVLYIRVCFVHFLKALFQLHLLKHLLVGHLYVYKGKGSRGEVRISRDIHFYIPAVNCC